MTGGSLRFPQEERRGLEEKGQASAINYTVLVLGFVAHWEHRPLPLPGAGPTGDEETNIKLHSDLPEARGRAQRALGLLDVLCVPALQVAQVDGLEGLQAGVGDLLHVLLHQAPLTA